VCGRLIGLLALSRRSLLPCRCSRTRSCSSSTRLCCRRRWQRGPSCPEASVTRLLEAASSPSLPVLRAFAPSAPASVSTAGLPTPLCSIDPTAARQQGKDANGQDVAQATSRTAAHLHNPGRHDVTVPPRPRYSRLASATKRLRRGRRHRHMPYRHASQVRGHRGAPPVHPPSS
jgi:hypothetical protein